jgi:cytochrome c556
MATVTLSAAFWRSAKENPRVSDKNADMTKNGVRITNSLRYMFRNIRPFDAD